MGSPFVYVQLHSRDPEGARDFYKQFLDWGYKDLPGATPAYAEILVGEGTAGGIMGTKDPAAPSVWVPFIRVADVHRATEKARSAGGTGLLPPTVVPGKGTFSLLLDPTGARFALWLPVEAGG